MRSFPRSFAVIAATFLAGACLVACSSQTGAERADSGAPAHGARADDPNALLVVAEVALQRGQYLDAARAYAQAAEASSDESLAQQATRVAYEHHQTTEMYRSATRWLELNPTSEEPHRYAAFGALRLYRLADAADHFDALLGTAYINVPAGFLALLPLMLDETPAAGVTTVLTDLVARHPDIAESHFALAQSALRSDNLALALEHAERAVDLSPYWSPAGMLLARARLANGDRDGALAQVKAVVERDGQPANRIERALIELAIGDEKAARDELDLLAADPEFAAGAERAFALLDLRDGKIDEAGERFEDLLRQGRFVYESLFHLGSIAESRNDTNAAVGLYARISAGDFAVPAQTRVARIKAKDESLDAGLAHLEQFAEDHPAYAIDMIAARSALRENEGDPDGALQVLDAALESYPDASQLELQKAFLFERIGKSDDSIRVLEKLAKARPGDPIVMNALGYTLVDHTRRYREGEELIKRALEQSPDSGAILDSMGWVLYKTRHYDEALGYLERARERIQDPELELHVGEVQWALDKRDDALATWHAAAERYPDDKDLSERIERAERGH
jgi:tetratricopeptide (TPR) repeat protein